MVRISFAFKNALLFLAGLSALSIKIHIRILAQQVTKANAESNTMSQVTYSEVSGVAEGTGNLPTNAAGLSMDTRTRQLSSPLLESHYAGPEDFLQGQNATPIFWHIPKAGGTSIHDFCLCLQLKVASHWGTVVKPSNESYSLDIGQRNDKQYVKVDTTKIETLREAARLGFATNQPADMISTPFPVAAGKYLFDNTHKGQLYTMVRHPVERALSLFYYLQHASWEPTYSPQWINLTVVEYVSSEAFESNWMTSTLSQALDNEDSIKESHVLTDDDFERAKNLLSKMVIGMTDNVSESVSRGGSMFGWNLNPRWTQCTTSAADKPSNSHKHPTFHEGSPEWDLIASKNNYDMKLFEHAEMLFKQQTQMMPLTTHNTTKINLQRKEDGSS
jgi:hypothetical protein